MDFKTTLKHYILLYIYNFVVLHLDQQPENKKQNKKGLF